MRYFRTYPWGLQILMFLLMTFTFISSIGAIILGVFTKITGFQATDLAGIKPDSPIALIKAAITVQGLENLFVFALPALTFAYLAHPRPMEYLGLRRPGKNSQVLLTLLIMAGAMPVLIFIENLVGLIDFGKNVKAAQAANNDMMRAFMKMNGLGGFIKAFVVMAIIPALGEEFFFRGTLMRFVKKRTGNMLYPVIFSAAVFSFSHANVYGYLSIFLAGVLLAVIYNLTGSLWCSILAHMFFNGTQIVLQYFSTSNGLVRTLVESDNMPYSYVIGGIALFAVSFYLLWKHKTPLPGTWAEDFSADEMAGLKAEKRNRLF